MNIDAILKKIVNKKYKQIYYVSHDCYDDLIGVTFDNIVTYWLDKNLIDIPTDRNVINITKKIDIDNYHLANNVMLYEYEDKKKFVINNKVVINRKLLKYVNIKKIGMYYSTKKFEPVIIFEELGAQRLIATVMPIWMAEPIKNISRKAEKEERII